MSKSSFMEKAIELALENVTSGHGGPFGAVIVKNGQIIGIGKNEVTASNDPTAHAEIQAIRRACEHLSDYQLTDCELYTSCEPCPMCIGAIYWARPKAVYYACTKVEASQIGFDDHFIYEQLELPIEQRKLQMKQIHIPEYDKPFRAWEASTIRKEY